MLGSRSLEVKAWVWCFIFGVAAATSQAADLLSDWQPSSVVGPAKCQKCHKPQYRVWEDSPHNIGFLDEEFDSEEIAEKMGVSDPESSSALCSQCHFTRGAKLHGELATVSCESCHNPAKNWLETHGTYRDATGKKVNKKEQEAPAQRQKRLAAADRAGMVRPGHAYRLAKNCLSCHLVPNQKLINQGGHPSKLTFELLSWSQGEQIRHNFSLGSHNPPVSKSRQRLLYVMGQMVQYELLLKMTQGATGKYAQVQKEKLQQTRNRLKQIQTKLGDPMVAKVLSATNAGQAAQAAKAFANKYAQGISSSAVDSLLPAANTYKN